MSESNSPFVDPRAAFLENVVQAKRARALPAPAAGGGSLWPSPAQELLLHAAVRPAPESLAAWEAWRLHHDLRESALDHGSFRLLPLVYRNLAANGAESAELPRLKDIYRYWWCWNQSLFAESVPLLAALHQAGVRTLMLKGAATALLYHEDPGVRPMADVDVLVPFSQVHQAVECLATLGWRAATGRIDEEIRYRHSTAMVNGQGREFDLHWHALREGLRPDSDHGFWSRAVPFTIHGVATCGLAPADALLHALVHGLRWNEEPAVRWIADAMAILQRAGIDWDTLVAEACRRGVALRAARALEYLRHTFGAAVPESVCQHLAQAGSRRERLELRELAERAQHAGRASLPRLGTLLLLEYLRVADGQPWPRALRALPGFLRYRLRSSAAAADAVSAAVRRLPAPAASRTT